VAVVDSTKIIQVTETFEKYIFLLKFKEGETFNHRNTLSISRIKI
jgi:hypothetical protein